MTTDSLAVRPFSIDISRDDLDDLRRRIAATRWPDEPAEAGWDYGANRAFLQELLAHWGSRFDWAAQQARLNTLPQFVGEIDGFEIHFAHVRGGGERSIPLLLLHGWPMTFAQMEPILPLLTQGEPSFDVVVPSLPGYGFSARPRERGVGVAQIARLFDRLMRGLGYDRYGVRASDIGAGVAAGLPRRSLIGVHQSGTNPFIQELPTDPSEREQEFVASLQQWVQQEFAYGQLHSTKPQTPAFGLNDSPAGLAAWVVEKLRAWSDCDGEIERVFTKDDICTNLTIYWVTQTIGSSMRLYYESMRNWVQPDDADVAVANAVAMFPKDMVPTPRSFAERQGPIDRWTDMPRGGHFGEWEEPELLADDIRSFFAELH